uniref:ATP synthase F0 subunit 8 n=1 Tax=Monodopsis sp. MarTras21 TaxID=1745953 RepID=A0A140F2Y0_9STRA|nr:ATP synthase F0 subunit 8 [Monodopsis sp. MarTras21]
MPQFDKITFFNQIFWFLLTFLGFYFIVLKTLLPVLAASLKTRKKIINYITLAGSSLGESSSKKIYFKNLEKFLKSHKNLFSSLAQKKSSLSTSSKTKIFTQTII